MNSADINTLTCNYYQIGPITIRTNSLIDLLLMIAEEPLFDSLRSKEQLGYDVSCCLHDNHGILSYSVTVNSQETKFSAEHIDERIEAFRVALLSIIREASDSEFDQYKESIVKIKLTGDNNLTEEVCRNWTEITTNEYAFDRAAKEVECLKNITKSEFLDFYEKHLLEHTKKLSVQVNTKFQIFYRIQLFKNSLVNRLLVDPTLRWIWLINRKQMNQRLCLINGLIN